MFMKTSGNSGYLGLIILGVIVLVISFIISYFWIILLVIVLIAIVAIVYSVSSSKSSPKQEDAQQHQEIISDNTQPSNRSITNYYTKNTTTYSINSKTYRERPKIKYSKVKTVPDTYVVFDLETTGLDYIENDILEIGAIKYNNGSEIDRFHTYIRINKTIPQRITEINGISNETIKDAPLSRSVLKDFINFIEDYTLIAYNSDFDMSFIQYNCQNRLKKTINNDVIDALPLAREYLPGLLNHKLQTIKKHFELNVGSHNAIDDCIVTNHLYQYCRQFEEIKYRYIIPFSYKPRELSDKEVEYINTIVEICEKNGIERKNLSMYEKHNLLVVAIHNQIVISLKLYGRLQYALFNLPLSNFDARFQTTIKHTESIRSEGNGTRVFVDSPEQLWEFEPLIIKKFKVCSTK